jgi:GWxTD domain-containing protein
LTALENLRSRAAALAIPATGGSLVKRVRRLLHQRETSRPAWTALASVGFVTALTVIALAAHSANPPKLEATPVTYSPPSQRTVAPKPSAPEIPAASPATEPQERPTYKAEQAEQPPQAARRWLDEDVAYIITDEEREAYSRLTTGDERMQFIMQFWLRRDPTPGTPENELRNDHYRRIAFANDHFSTSSGTPGWKTDRGQTYIKWGPPDEISKMGVSVSATEIWRYRYIETLGRNNITFVFVDVDGSGELRRFVQPTER